MTKTNKTAFRYLAAGLIMGVITIVTCQKAAGQTISRADSIAANRFVDSVENNTSIKVFKEWLIDVTNAKIYLQFESTYNAYIQQKYNSWLQQKAAKPKSK